MPTWLSAAIAAAPGAAVAIFAIWVGGKLLDKYLDILKIRTMRSGPPTTVIVKSGADWVWVLPGGPNAKPPETEPPPARPQLQVVGKPELDTGPPTQSG